MCLGQGQSLVIEIVASRLKPGSHNPESYKGRFFPAMPSLEQDVLCGVVCSERPSLASPVQPWR